MYKTELIRMVSRDTRLSQRIVSDVIEASHRLIEQTLREGNSVTFPGFGTFLTREKQAGQVKDVRTGELVRYEARRVAAFKVGEVLKRAVRGDRRRGGPKRKAQVGKRSRGANGAP
jgi:DNA-binding protein HU-beta